MKTFLFVGVSIFSMIAGAGSEGMSSMPVLKPKKIFSVKNAAELEEQKGFGEQAPTVKMMNLMMVEGSGMEGMDMAAHSSNRLKNDATVKSESIYEVVLTSPLVEKVGSNKIEFTVKIKQKLVKGLKLQVKVYMTSMDMGTEEPAVKEIAPGSYQVKVSFSMKGPWAVKIVFPDKSEKILNFKTTTK